MSPGWALLVVVGMLSLGACSAAEPGADAASPDPPASSEPAESPSTEDEVEVVPLASIAEIAGTRWTGTDSDGDSHGLSFKEDGSLTHSQGGMRQDTTWAVEGETVVFTIVFGPGSITEITGTLDPATQTMSAVGVDSLGEVTFEFTRLD